MANSAVKATANAKVESTAASRNWVGYCLMFVRITLGIAARYASAIKAWDAATGKHPGDRHPPKGAPVFWRIGKYGHIALADGNGKVWSTDIRRRGKVDLVPLGEVEARWGAKYLGWAETLNGQRVIAKPKASAKLADYVKPGGRGPQVADLQRALVVAGYGPIPHAPTEFYGGETKAAVSRFHNKNRSFRQSGNDVEIGPKGYAELLRQAAK